LKDTFLINIKFIEKNLSLTQNFTILHETLLLSSYILLIN